MNWQIVAAVAFSAGLFTVLVQIADKLDRIIALLERRK